MQSDNMNNLIKQPVKTSLISPKAGHIVQLNGLNFLGLEILK
jgi:hypothetical protein